MQLPATLIKFLKMQTCNIHMVISEESKNYGLFPHYARGAIKLLCIPLVSTPAAVSCREAARGTQGSAGRWWREMPPY